MVRKMSVPVLLFLLAGSTWSSDSTGSADPSGFEPVFEPVAAPVFNPTPTPVATENSAPIAAPADSIIAAADSSVETPVEEAAPGIEVIPQAPPSLDPKAVQMAKEKALQDSIASVEQSITTACNNVEMTPLAPKDEFETSDAFNTRKATWEKIREDKCASVVGPLKKKKDDLAIALKDVQKNAGDLKGSLEITSRPKGARVFVDGVEMGKTPLTLEDQWAGKVMIKLMLDGYQEFVTTAEIKAKDAAEIKAALQEKSIFSEMGEVNLSALLAKDSASVVVYQGRIAVIQARLAQVKEQYENLLLEIRLKSPLQPKTEFETQDAFNKREKEWKEKNEEQSAGTKKKYEIYTTRLNRAIEVLQDFILAQAGQPKSLSIPASQMTLGSYNADSSLYGFVVENEQEGHPFHYEGSLTMSPEDAKATNKVSDGFNLNAKYYDIPVVYNGSTIYPAWHSLEVAKADKNFPTNGAFKLPAVWYDDPSVAAAIVRADSLRKGLINVRGLEAAYALEYGAGSSGSSSRVWMWVARGILFASSAAAGTYGYLQQKEADKLSDEYDPINAQQGKDKLQEIRDCELRRDRSYFTSAILAIAGTITFAF